MILPRMTPVRKYFGSIPLMLSLGNGYFHKLVHILWFQNLLAVKLCLHSAFNSQILVIGLQVNDFELMR